MLERKTIKLPQPIVGHEGPITHIVLREPTYEEFMSFGEPILYGVSPEGRPFAVENMEAIRQYVSACLVEPKDPAVLMAQAGALVAREVKEKILSFFPVGGLEAAPSATSPTTSSSAASDVSVQSNSNA